MQTIHPLQRIVHLIGLIGTPLVALAWIWGQRGFDFANADGRYGTLAEHADEVGALSAGFLVMQFLLVPAALAFVWIVRGRGRVLVLLGAGAFVVSALGHSAMSGADLLLAQMLQSSDSAAMQAAYEDFEGSPGFALVVAPGLLGLLLGNVLLGIGVIRSRELHWSIGLALFGFIVFDFFLVNVASELALLAAASWAYAMWATALHSWRRPALDRSPADATDAERRSELVGQS